MNDEHEETVSMDEGNTEQELDFEPEDEMGSVGAVQAKLKKVRLELTESNKEKQSNLDGWQRSKADLVNFRREAIATTERAVARTKEGIIEDIIPVLDSFDMAMGGTSWESVDPVWRSGVEQIRNQLLDVLVKNGVQRYGASGEVFDHNLHEAVQEVDEGEGSSNSIVRVLRYGYRNTDHVIRPAQVIVRK
ncbi:MAG: GrpE protein [Candidatus Kaiserbacteria bacterium]|nr:GrpE protein [Candidatus Kaiserbacteria bacterium]